jgi:hypothetical protein
MSMLNTTSMFQSIKNALAKSEEKSSSGLYNEILKTTPGNTYTVRLLPFAKDPSKTFFHYFIHGWNSFATGQYVQAVSPQTFNERDPISEERFRVLRSGTEDQKEKMQVVRRAEKWLVNVYVIEDPSNPANNGTVKILRYGKQLQKIIMDAIEGEDSEEYGERIFDLSANGVSLKIKVEEQAGYPTYTSSRFTGAGKINLSEEEQEKIYNSTFNLEEVQQVKSYDELKQMLNEHVYCKIDEPQPTVSVSTTANSVSNPAPVVTSFATAPANTIEDDINELLKDL